MLMEWKNHHIHSYDMLIHAELPTLTHREVELIANIARYHRGPAPRASHANFHHLGDDDQRLVRHLAGILRVADGLDRLHTQNVTGVTVEVESEWVRFEAHAEEDPTVNLEFARKKADLFEDAFHGRTKFRWQPSPARAAVFRVKG
jgi:exopolyphosphatase/guanosine-5'-triphosphate,3'-diphosphate pyrophosphatase